MTDCLKNGRDSHQTENEGTDMMERKTKGTKWEELHLPNYHISNIIHPEGSNIPCIIPAGESSDHGIAFVTLLNNRIAAVHDAIMILDNIPIEGIGGNQESHRKSGEQWNNRTKPRFCQYP